MNRHNPETSVNAEFSDSNSRSRTYFLVGNLSFNSGRCGPASRTRGGRVFPASAGGAPASAGAPLLDDDEDELDDDDADEELDDDDDVDFVGVPTICTGAANFARSIGILSSPRKHILGEESVKLSQIL